jgi:hypothetical protein
MSLSFNAVQALPGAAHQLLYDLAVRVRPTDGRAFVLGAKNKVFLGPYADGSIQDITGQAGENTNQWPSLAFGPDGRGYAAWRYTPSGFRAWLQPIPAGYAGGPISLAGFDLSGPLARAAGADFADQPALAVSPLTGRLYCAAYFSYPDHAATGLAESADGGHTWGNFKDLARDPGRSNQGPDIVIGANDDIHVTARNGDSLVVISRRAGVWDAAPTVIASSQTDPGWDVRAVDGHVSKAVAVAPDGTAWLVWKHNVTGSFGLARRAPGAAWQRLSVDPLQRKLFTATVTAGCGPDGTLYVAHQGDDGPYNGSYVLAFRYEAGLAGYGAVPVKPETTWGSAGISLDARGYGGYVYVACANKTNRPEATFVSWAALEGLGPVTPPTPIPVPQPLPPPPAPTPPPAPPVDDFLPPSSLAAEALSFNQVRLTWKDKTADEVEFSLERKEGTTDWRIVGSAGPNATEWLDVIAIEPKTTYTYRVRAHKTGRYSPYTREVTATTPAKPVEPPPVPAPVPEPAPAPAPVPAPEPLPVPLPLPHDPLVVVMGAYMVGHGILAYWNILKRDDAPHPLGLPLSNEFDYTDETGRAYVAQAFERAIVGYDGTVPDVRYRVQPLLIGYDWLKAHHP